MVLKDLKMKRGFRVYSVDELDLPLIFNYDQEINRAEDQLKRDRDFQFIFNSEMDSEKEDYRTSKRQQLNLNAKKYEGLVNIFRWLNLILGELVLKSVAEEYPLSRPLALKSLAGCPAQREHRDFQTKFEKVSFGVLWSPFMDTKVLLSPYSHTLKKALKVLYI